MNTHMKAVRACINKLIDLAKTFEHRLLRKYDPAKLLAHLEGIFQRLFYPSLKNQSSLNRTPEPEKTDPDITRIRKKPVRVGEIIASTSSGLRKNIESLERPKERFIYVGKASNELLDGLIPEKIKPEPWHIRLKKTLDLFNLSHWNRRKTFGFTQLDGKLLCRRPPSIQGEHKFIWTRNQARSIYTSTSNVLL